MNILSWDVGIKHLAYNLTEYTYNKETQKISIVIKQWNIINLSLEQCSFCEKDGLYIFNINDSCKYYCDTHCKKLKIKHYCYFDGCHEKAKYDVDNKYICENHGPKTYSNDDAIECLKYKLIEKLDKINFINFEYVLIENQPTFKNPKMKAIADTLYAWFLIRKIVDEKCLQIKNIRLISPSRKNTLFTPTVIKNEVTEIIPDSVTEPEIKKKLTYQEGKKMSIEFCCSIINEEWNIFLKKFSKKDDLADCLLQGYSFYFSLNNIKSKRKYGKT